MPGLPGDMGTDGLPGARGVPGKMVRKTEVSLVHFLMQVLLFRAW